MDVLNIPAWPREERGSRDCRRVRRQGLVPGVLYGRKKPNVLLVVREHDLRRAMEEHALVVELTLDGQREHAQIKEIQLDELGERLLHADFARISLAEKIQVAVPVEVRGEAGEGGVVELMLHELDVECLPQAVPEKITVDVSQLGIGDSLRIADLQFPADVAPVAEGDVVVVSVVPPTVEEEGEEEAPEEARLEPELIGKEEEPEEEKPE